MLTEIVQPGKALGTVRTREWSLAGVLAAVAGQMLGPREGLVTIGETRALEHPALQWPFGFLFLIRHGEVKPTSNCGLYSGSLLSCAAPLLMDLMLLMVFL